MPNSNPDPLPISEPPRYENSLDAVIAVYKRDVDRTLLRENLRLSVDERLQRLTRHLELSKQLREAGRRLP